MMETSGASNSELHSEQLSKPMRSKTLLPHFDDASVEAAYAAHRFEQSTERGLSVIFFLCAVVVLVIFSTLTVNNAGEAINLFRLVPQSLLVVSGILYALALRKVPGCASKYYEVYIWIVMYVFSACQGFTNDRIAILLGLGDDDWTASTLAEARTVGAVLATIAINCTFVRPSSLNALILVHACVFTYVIFLMALGSMEFTCIVDEYDARNTPEKSYIVLGVFVYIAAILMWAGRRSQDRHERENFFHSYRMEKQLEDQQKRERALQTRLHDLDQLNQALHAAGKSSTTSIAPEGGTGKPPPIVAVKGKGGKGITEEPRDLRAPTPVPETKLEGKASSNQSSIFQEQVPNADLVRIMAGRSTDWDRIRRMAERIKDPDYKLQEFFQDSIVSFPELALFIESSTGDTAANLSSGRSAEAEYQRTIGALFAVYWMLRLDDDGAEGFCYGVDADWKPVSPPSPSCRTLASPSLEREKTFFQMNDDEKRKHFLQKTDWSMFNDLVVQAGCTSFSPGHTERIMAMLCLTAFHDVMKVEDLLPCVQAEHAPYLGYAAGNKIHDHDIALSYILEHYSHLMPSFAGLPPEQRRTIIFTQGKLQFNHGWFVQAEAPPGAMLTKFKEALKNNISPADIAFYFLHWFTDLSGADATPLGGSQKFVLKFPHKVLASFLWSMPFLGELATETETAVVQRYLEARLTTLSPDYPVPKDVEAIACMRLVAMTQSDLNVIDVFRGLPEVHQKIISKEFARTGCTGQMYASNPVVNGPAFLLYYGPALLQRNANSGPDLAGAMMALSHVLYAARILWPARREMQGSTVTIQIGQLKSQDISAVMSCPMNDVRSVWVLLWQNDLEGCVELHRGSSLNEMYANGARFLVIDFGATLPNPKTEDDSPGRNEADTTPDMREKEVSFGKEMQLKHVPITNHKDASSWSDSVHKIKPGENVML